MSDRFFSSGTNEHTYMMLKAKLLEFEITDSNQEHDDKYSFKRYSRM